MNDIPQWRRMIQPSRSRTPAVEPEDSDGMASPVTPKRGLKPTISSYLTHHGLTVKSEPSYASLNEDPFSPGLPAWPEEQPYPHPDAEGLIDSIMCRLMTEPYSSLDPRFNGMLLHIFEGHRNVRDCKQQMEEQLDDAMQGKKSLLYRLQQAQKQMSEQRQEYKAEIKRLELLLAKGKRGLAEVTIARQDSQLRQRESHRRSEQLDDGLRTIFDVLERTQRSDEKTYGTQRGTLLAPPSSTLVEAASVSEPKTSTSNDTFSAFSCKGDLLPDEFANLTRAIDRQGTAGFQLRTHPSAEGDGTRSAAATMTAVTAVTQTSRAVARSFSSSAGAAAFGNVPKRHPSLMAKASGFFHKLKPHAATSTHTDMRFSFRTGDDTTGLAVPDQTTRRRSMSSESLPVHQTVLSPILPSPTASVTFSDSCRASRIPVPIHGSGSIARPRQERENLASSPLATTEHQPDSAKSDEGTWAVTAVDNYRLELPTHIRGNAFVAAVARDALRRADSSGLSECRTDRSTMKAHADSDMSESMKENACPITEYDDYVDDDDDQDHESIP
ncbi:hypothetical protein LTR35_000038 [Friedmanniomyces endolithicus]|uniref:Uncharacterized protein n=1 Tax=Friedmanniomyces endolithicus TaxID=329885 RepID=A0AAN6J791_9PEZI|nr:hypothetical protein LTS00_008683 [Friedmanniomyces endolithicus]KAK0293434.1 hypothetical protein LTR35_000038 [Friedmanniomyces endolithicus]KAK0318990.1 hypothetical protein LTR82_010090 [Friedmanniomyces endolithicus]KAK0997424.1 hypothetical protein LTR54_009884 [Friedmanniomyces endolithicus]